MNERPISALQAHITTDFEQAFHLYHKQVYQFLLRSSCDPDLAETLTQECFLKAYQKWSTFRGEAKLSSWLIRIAINLERDYWRRGNSQFWHKACTASLDSEETGHLAPVSFETPEKASSVRQQIEMVFEFLSSLPEAQKRVFILKNIEELTLKEIAQLIGLRVGTVKAHLCRARTKIQRSLAFR